MIISLRTITFAGGIDKVKSMPGIAIASGMPGKSTAGANIDQ
ncbi:MAG: hypothetical protein R2845_02070 [Thermomicrobiales bacterium]